MPIVPMTGMQTGSTGESPLTSKPSDSDLLMAAASLHKQGKLAPDPAVSMPSAQSSQPNPAKPNKKRKLKVIR